MISIHNINGQNLDRMIQKRIKTWLFIVVSKSFLYSRNFSLFLKGFILNVASWLMIIFYKSIYELFNQPILMIFENKLPLWHHYKWPLLNLLIKIRKYLFLHIYSDNTPRVY